MGGKVSRGEKANSILKSSGDSVDNNDMMSSEQSKSMLDLFASCSFIKTFLTVAKFDLSTNLI